MRQAGSGAQRSNQGMQASAAMPDSEMAAQWECEACTLINEADWDYCAACETRKSESSASFSHSQAGARTGAEAPGMRGWGCTHCTFINDDDRTHCSVCYTRKPLNPTRPPPPIDEATLERVLEERAASEKLASKGNGGNVGGPGFDDDVPDYF